MLFTKSNTKEFVLRNKYYFIFAIFFALVTFVSFQQSVWLDESLSIDFSRQTISKIFDISIHGDLHPPLYSIFLHFSGLIFGKDVLIYRLWSGLLFIASGALLLKYFKEKEWLSENRLTYLLIFLLSPFSIYYASESRSYMAVIFVSLVQFIFFDKLCENFEKKSLVYYTLSSIVGIYLFYPIIFSLVGQFFYVVFLKRELFKKIIMPWVVIGLTYVPWIYLVIAKRIAEEPGHFLPVPWWQIPAVIFVGFSGGRVSITDVNHLHWYWPTLLIAVANLFILFGLWYWWKSKTDRDYLYRLLFLFAFPIFICLVVSYLRFPIFDPRYYTEVFPLYIIILSGSFEYLRKKFVKIAKYFLLLLFFANLIFLGLYLFNPWFAREPWKTVVPELESQLTPSDAVVFIGFQQPPPAYSIYQKKDVKIVSTYESDLKDLNDYATIEKDLDREIVGRNRIWYSQFLEWQKDPGSNIRKLIEKNYRYVKTVGFFKVKFDLYEKK